MTALHNGKAFIFGTLHGHIFLYFRNGRFFRLLKRTAHPYRQNIQQLLVCKQGHVISRAFSTPWNYFDIKYRIYFLNSFL